MTKYCFVTGGVVSGIGKGITSASLGRLLKARGFRIAILKIDPYINVDAGLMNPFQHGEVYVTDDGAETDLDLGHYERFVDEPLSQLSNATTGQIYGSVIAKERDGDYYLGQTVQVIPHITDEIKMRIRKCANAYEAEVCIVEIGGTVGDIEGQPFYEAIRQMRIEEGRENTCYMHVTLVPYLDSIGELKTKPSQHSVAELRSIGIQPDILIVRAARELSKEVRRKLSLFCDVPVENVVSCVDVKESLYHIPLALERQKVAEIVSKALDLPLREPDLSEWHDICNRYAHPTSEVTIAMVGKYMDLQDAYLSVTEALMHGGIANVARVKIKYVDSESIEHDGAETYLNDVHGVIVPGGFGDRGIQGKIEAIRYARESKIPYLGLCLGLQTAVIEFARNVCGLEKADSREFKSDTPDPVIVYLKEQEYITELGGTMRLGAYPCTLQEQSLASRLYEAQEISERHRHRLEVNNDYREQLTAKGLVISGTSPEGDLVEIVELPDHPFFIACQFHPEFKSLPNRAHPLFRGFITAALAHASAAGEAEAPATEE